MVSFLGGREGGMLLSTSEGGVSVLYGVGGDTGVASLNGAGDS